MQYSMQNKQNCVARIFIFLSRCRELYYHFQCNSSKNGQKSHLRIILGIQQVTLMQLYISIQLVILLQLGI